MLVLSRKQNQSVWIAGRIKITVIKVRGTQVRLGIEAAHDIPVLRSELAGPPGKKSGDRLCRPAGPEAPRDRGYVPACCQFAGLGRS